MTSDLARQFGVGGYWFIISGIPGGVLRIYENIFYEGD